MSIHEMYTLIALASSISLISAKLRIKIGITLIIENY